MTTAQSSGRSRITVRVQHLIAMLQTLSQEGWKLLTAYLSWYQVKPLFVRSTTPVPCLMAWPTIAYSTALMTCTDQ